MLVISSFISITTIVAIVIGFVLHLTGFIFFVYEAFTKLEWIYGDQMKLIFVDHMEYTHVVINSLMRYARINYMDLDPDPSNHVGRRSAYKDELDKLRCKMDISDSISKIFFKSQYMNNLSNCLGLSKLYLIISNIYYLALYIILLYGNQNMYFWLIMPVIILVFTTFLNFVLWNLGFLIIDILKSGLLAKINFVIVSFLMFMGIFSLQTMPVFVIIILAN